MRLRLLPILGISVFLFAAILYPDLYAEDKTKSSENSKNMTFKAEVDYILDGDSIRLWLPEEKRLIMMSLYGIDCPELDQPFGEKAKEFIEESLKEKKIVVSIVQVGNHNTALGYIYMDGDDLGFKMIENGLAEVDRGTSRAFTDPKARDIYLNAQKKVKEEKVGMWIQGDDYESPVDYLIRARQKKGKGSRH